MDNRLYLGNCIDILDSLNNDGVKVDLTVTSPPYDDLRTYGQTCEWDFEIFKQVADRLYEITNDGGILVWVVGDATIKGHETLSSFKQALYFDSIGFKMHDTMIYEKNSSTFPAKRTSKRYTQIFEYMFVFVKGKIRNDIVLLADKPNKWAGHTNWGKVNQYDKDGNIVVGNDIKPVPEFSIRNNIWKYTVGFNDKTGHPAVFPEKLAEDHILSWSVEGDIVLDPFSGSGTTGKMAMMNGRKYIGIERNETYFDKSIERFNKYNLAIDVIK